MQSGHLADNTWMHTVRCISVGSHRCPARLYVHQGRTIDLWSWNDLQSDQRACSITCMHINAIYSVYASTCECTQFYAFLLVPIDAGLDYTCVWAVLSICEAGMTASVTSVRAASHSCTWITFSDGGSAISSYLKTGEKSTCKSSAKRLLSLRRNQRVPQAQPTLSNKKVVNFSTSIFFIRLRRQVPFS